MFIAVARCEQTSPCSFTNLCQEPGWSSGKAQGEGERMEHTSAPRLLCQHSAVGLPQGRNGNRGFDVPDSPMNAPLSHGAWEEDMEAEALS